MNIRTETTKLLHDLGIPAHLSGFDYLREAITRSVKDPAIPHSMTKLLYPQVAAQFDTTASRVERAMRHAVEVAFTRGDLAQLQTVFRNTVRADKGRPTNGEFIALCADDLRLKGEAGHD